MIKFFNKTRSQEAEKVLERLEQYTVRKQPKRKASEGAVSFESTLKRRKITDDERALEPEMEQLRFIVAEFKKGQPRPDQVSNIVAEEDSEELSTQQEPTSISSRSENVPLA